MTKQQKKSKTKQKTPLSAQLLRLADLLISTFLLQKCPPPIKVVPSPSLEIILLNKVSPNLSRALFLYLITCFSNNSCLPKNQASKPKQLLTEYRQK